MARTFDGVDDQIRCSVGAITFVAPITMAMIVRRNADAVEHQLIRGVTSGGLNRWGYGFGPDNSLRWTSEVNVVTSGFTVTVADGWCLVATRKASGTTVPGKDKYVFSTNAWTHETTGTSLADGSALASGDTIRIGTRDNAAYLSGEVAVAAIWDRRLSNAEVETLSFSLAHWIASAPRALWVFDQSVLTQKVVDMMGGGANETTGGVGTAVSTVSVPLFSYGAVPTRVTKPLAGIAVSQAIAALFEALLLNQPTSLYPLEASFSVSPSTSEPLEALLAQALSAAEPLEALSMSSPSALSPWAALLSLALPVAEPLEALVPQAPSVGFVYEALAQALLDSSLAWASLGAPAQTSLDSWEAVGSLPVSLVFPLEGLSSLTLVGAPLILEGLVSLALVGQSPWELAAALAAQTLEPLEALVSSNGLSTQVVESLLSAALSGVPAWEALGLSASPSSPAWEALGLAASGLDSPYEARALMAASLAAWLESLSDGRASSMSWAEALALTQSSADTPWEALRAKALVLLLAQYGILRTLAAQYGLPRTQGVAYGIRRLLLTQNAFLRNVLTTLGQSRRIE